MSRYNTYCDFCGCYIPYEWERCPACEAIHHNQKDISPLAKAVLNNERIQPHNTMNIVSFNGLTFMGDDSMIKEYIEQLSKNTPKMPTSYTH